MITDDLPSDKQGKSPSLSLRLCLILVGLLVTMMGAAGCESKDKTGVLDAFEQNYYQLRYSTRAAAEVSAEMMANLSDSLNSRLLDTNLLASNTLAEEFSLADTFKKKYKRMLDLLKEVERKTNQVMDNMDVHARHMEAIAVRNPENGQFMERDENKNSYRYWMDKGTALQLRSDLRSYGNTLKNLPGNEDLNFSDVDDDLLWLQFSNKRPVISYMALLEGLKNSVYRHQQHALKEFSGQIGAPYFRPNKLIVRNVPESKAVPAGAEFRTFLGVGLTSSRIKALYEGEGISINEDSTTAMLSVAADGNVIPDSAREGLQRYTATVRVPRVDGAYEVLTVEDEFIVRRPDVVVKSPDIQVLYRNCKNTLDIEIPDLGDDYQPFFELTNGTITADPEVPHRYHLNPTENPCIVGIFSLIAGDTVKVDELNYRVIDPPKPRIEYWVNDQLFNGTKPIPSTSRILLKVIPDPEFKAAMPSDARYGVEEVEVLAQWTLQHPEVESTNSGAGREGDKGIPVSLGERIREAIPGLRVYLRVKGLYRKNHLGEDLLVTSYQDSELVTGMVVR